MLIREDIDKDPSSTLSSQQSVKPPAETLLNIPPLVQPIAQPSVAEVSTNAVDLPSGKTSVDEKKKKKQLEDIEKELQERERKQRLKEEVSTVEIVNISLYLTCSPSSFNDQTDIKFKSQISLNDR